MKWVVLIALLLILFSLGTALYQLIKHGHHGKALDKALTWRIGLSITLFLFLMVSFAMGWITPHGIV